MKQSFVRGVLCLTSVLLIMGYAAGEGPQAAARPADGGSHEKAACEDKPPFVAPSRETPTVLNGTTILPSLTLYWRLFSPDITSFQRGDFWTCFDIASSTTEGFECLNFNVSFYDPDDEDRSHPNGIVYGGGFVSEVIEQDGNFIQYLAFRNSSYFFMNSTYPYVTYPAVDDEMIIVLSTLDMPTVKLFNITVETETLFPEVESISPSSPNTGGVRSLNSINRTMTINASDPTGLSTSRLYGRYVNTSTPETDLLLLAENTTPQSGMPHRLTLSLDALEDYASVTGQNVTHVLVDAVLVVADLSRRATFLSFDLLFTNVTSSSTTTSLTSTTTVNWERPLLLTISSVLAVVAVLSVLVVRSRPSREGVEAMMATM